LERGTVTIDHGYVPIEQVNETDMFDGVVSGRDRSQPPGGQNGRWILMMSYCRLHHICANISASVIIVKPRILSRRTPQQITQQAHSRIAELRKELADIDYVCSGTLLKRMKTCGSSSCRCASDPAARHGPYYEWGHMKAGKLVHRLVSAEQAQTLLRAINNYRRLKKLLRSWEAETEQLIDAEASRQR
jgi:hypothetical protein